MPLFSPLTITQPQPLAGRGALVTGVTRRSGIGFAAAARLAQMGARVCIHSWLPGDTVRTEESEPGGMDALRDDLHAYGGQIAHVAADLGLPDAPGGLVAAATDAIGPLDILVVNHTHHEGPQALEDLTAAQIDRHLAVNVRGTLLLVQAWAGSHDDTRPGGRVVLFTSGQHRGPMPQELAYVASKGALHQLTASLAAHLAPRRITVNTIDPGPTDTGWPTPDVYEAVLKASPQGRWGQPDDAARVIAWLATDDSQWITGQVIDSRGGL